MTSFVRVWRLSGLRRLTFQRKLGTFERSRDCDPRPDPRSSSTDDDPHCEDPCPPPPEHPFQPHYGNGWKFLQRVSRTSPINSRLGAPGILRRRDLCGTRLELRRMIYRNGGRRVEKSEKRQSHVSPDNTLEKWNFKLHFVTTFIILLRTNK